MRRPVSVRVKGVVTRLVAALHALGLDGEIALAGHWVKLQGERCAVYVAEATSGGSYYTWCEDAEARVVEFYLDPTTAIEAGLRRAAQRGHGFNDATTGC